MKPRFPIFVPMVGEDGNAFAIMGRVRGALEENGIDSNLVSQFIEEATMGDYDHLLRTVMEWVEVD